MVQSEEDIPKLKTFWKIQQWANLDISGNTSEAKPFHTFFDAYANQPINNFQGINLKENKNNRAVLLTQFLIHYCKDKSIMDKDEISWVKQQFEKFLTPVQFSLKEDLNTFNETYPCTIHSTPLTFLLVLLGYVMPLPEDSDQNIFLQNKELTLIALFFLAVMGTLIADRCLFQNPQQNYYTFWNIGKKRPIDPEIQTLFDYLDKEIKQIEKTMGLTTDGIKLKID